MNIMTGTEVFKRTSTYEREAPSIRMHAPQWKLLLAFGRPAQPGRGGAKREHAVSPSPLAQTEIFLKNDWISEQPITLDEYLKRASASGSFSGGVIPPSVVLHEPKPELPKTAMKPRSENGTPPVGPADATRADLFPRAARCASPPLLTTWSRWRRRSPLGQLLAYRVFLRVPPEVLQSEEIVSIHLVDDTSIIRTTALQKAIAAAVLEIAKRRAARLGLRRGLGLPSRDGGNRRASCHPALTGPADREAVRAICADTGFLGQPIDPVFEDRELFADYLTAYYTDAEPESTFVCEIDGEVKGYVMGSRFPQKKARLREARKLPGLVLRGGWRYFTRPYHAATRRYVRWLLTRARHEVPFHAAGHPPLSISTCGPRRGRWRRTRAIIDLFFANTWRGCGENGSLRTGCRLRDTARREDVRTLRLQGSSTSAR